MRFRATGHWVVSEAPAADERGWYGGWPRLIAGFDHSGDVSFSPVAVQCVAIWLWRSELVEVEFHAFDLGHCGEDRITMSGSRSGELSRRASRTVWTAGPAYGLDVME